MNEILGITFSLAYLAFVLLIGELIIRLVKSENARFISRKTVHILTCFLWFIMYHFLKGSYYPIALCGSLFILLLIFKRYLPSISDAENRFSGALLYAGVGTALSALCCFFPILYLPLGITMTALSLGDGFAGLIGKLLPRIKIHKEKTLFGTLSAFVFTLLSTTGFTHLYKLEILPVEILIIALAFAFTELLSPRSADNVTTSIITFLLTILALHTSVLTSYAFSFISIPIIAFAVIKKRALTTGGIIFAIIIALSIIIGLGDLGFLLLFTFFSLTTACDLFKKSKKQEILFNVHQKAFGRNASQVLAVGIIPAITAILAFITKNEVFFIAFVASIAESLGDCMASEIGVLSKKPPIDVFRLKRVDKGISGGISLLGSTASVIGIVIISVLYRLLPIYINKTLLLTMLAALFGVIVDTVLGSLLQRKNVCVNCGKITERTTHCGENTRHFSGISWLSNTFVNFISNVATAILAIIIYVIFF